MYKHIARRQSGTLWHQIPTQTLSGFSPGLMIPHVVWPNDFVSWHRFHRCSMKPINNRAAAHYHQLEPVTSRKTELRPDISPPLNIPEIIPPVLNTSISPPYKLYLSSQPATL